MQDINSSQKRAIQLEITLLEAYLYYIPKTSAMGIYRKLTDQELKQLKIQGNTSDNWESVKVNEGFTPERIQNVQFSGEIKIGRLEKVFNLNAGVKKRASISNATLHNCLIEDDVYINSVKNYIANYTIRSGAFIENVDSIYVEGESSFGNGIQIAVMNEQGGREVTMYNRLSSHVAYMMALYRHQPKLIAKLEELALNYAKNQKSTRGTIGEDTFIINSRTIRNVSIGAHATVESVYSLNNGSINSCKQDPSYFGPGVIADDFIASTGSTVTEATLISKCFIGQGCTLGKHYSAENSAFFANCQGFHGEACSVFAGPYSVSHHKSTLLISGYFSFLNAGSGSNQSNHMYKLGPIHQGVLERGSKTTSDSYLLWPARIGAFSLVMGRHYRNPDTSNLPFSYLIENKDESLLAPGVNLRSVGTVRDARKWPKRDKRKNVDILDFINFNLLSPFTIQKMLNGKKILENLQKTSGQTSEFYMYNSVKISNASLRRGIELYRIGIIKFLGNAFIKKLEGIPIDGLESLRKTLKPTTPFGEGEWIDLAGLLVPKNQIDLLIEEIESGAIQSIEEIEQKFKELHAMYYNFAWTWCHKILKEEFNMDMSTINFEQAINFVKEWKSCVVSLDELLYQDAKKEFTLKSQTSFGVDGTEETKVLEFEKVRGDFEQHASVIDIKKHIKSKSAIADELIRRLQAVTINI